MINTTSEFTGRAGHFDIKLEEQEQDTSIATAGLPRKGANNGSINSPNNIVRTSNK